MTTRQTSTVTRTYEPSLGGKGVTVVWTGTTSKWQKRTDTWTDNRRPAPQRKGDLLTVGVRDSRTSLRTGPRYVGPPSPLGPILSVWSVRGRGPFLHRTGPGRDLRSEEERGWDTPRPPGHTEGTSPTVLEKILKGKRNLLCFFERYWKVGSLAWDDGP